MQLKELQNNWDQLGREDPLWAILSMPDKIHNKWDLGEFFKTGIEEIQGVIELAGSLGVPLARTRALDFGCGVGRLTQALCRHFEKCCGIDLAPSMIKQAKEYNRYGARCEYYRNETDGLPIFQNESFDFIYSSLVLQHMNPGYSKKYIEEFLRILSPGGALVFQLPAELRPPAQPADVESVALPDSAFRARIKPHRRSLTATRNSRIEVVVTVTNLSSFTWPSAAASPIWPVRLGNHWLYGNGDLLQRDDERAPLEHDLGPMEETQMRLVVNTPADPGEYVLELDIVQEQIAWFGDKGSEVVRIKANIGDSGPSHAARQKGLAKIEMYGVARDEVVQTITRAGGEIRDIQEDSGAGPEWLSFRYFVTKPKLVTL